MLHLHTDSVLEVTIHSAHGLKDVERAGKNDVYVRISLEVDNNKFYDKFQTNVQKNAGVEATWEEKVDIREVKENHDTLYVEIMDSEKGVDAPIAYTAVPLGQVKDSNRSLSAKYTLYNENGLAQGDISLTIRIVNPGEESSGRITYDGNFKLGESRVDEAQKKRFKSLKLKENIADAGAATALGVLGGLGATFLAQKMGKKDTHKNDDENVAENN
ncbi:hypothetical protein BGZ96_003626 [Linnemannia gamsii]|uniref:C2 domain-containing protein n=1 Tax=Linnemannia gamsii TaxID=64522 RepID=A0ABQ7KH40_9FUNG|nr:hypothetical protein BGZ96_003626 [Linnemannia gamsii]